MAPHCLEVASHTEPRAERKESWASSWSYNIFLLIHHITTPRPLKQRLVNENYNLICRKKARQPWSTPKNHRKLPGTLPGASQNLNRRLAAVFKHPIWPAAGLGPCGPPTKGSLLS
ncbi:MAG: hypothetical protein ACK56F_09400, partial [bacterium]